MNAKPLKNADGISKMRYRKSAYIIKSPNS